jgi:hypothetical protein
MRVQILQRLEQAQQEQEQQREQQEQPREQQEQEQEQELHQEQPQEQPRERQEPHQEQQQDQEQLDLQQQQQRARQHLPDMHLEAPGQLLPAAPERSVSRMCRIHPIRSTSNSLQEGLQRERQHDDIPVLPRK